MNWLDLGWLKREEAWEFHPWGPFTRGYLVPGDEMIAVRRGIRSIRLCVALFAIFVLGACLHFRAPWVPAALLGVMAEAVSTWWMVRRFPRSPALGWEAGALYLAKWLGPKLLTVARWLAFFLLAFAIFFLILAPQQPLSYLLVGFFVGVLFVLFYLEQVQGGSG